MTVSATGNRVGNGFLQRYTAMGNPVLISGISFCFLRHGSYSIISENAGKRRPDDRWSMPGVYFSEANGIIAFSFEGDSIIRVAAGSE